jgi:hypothetical protein
MRLTDKTISNMAIAKVFKDYVRLLVKSAYSLLLSYGIGSKDKFHGFFSRWRISGDLLGRRVYPSLFGC